MYSQPEKNSLIPVRAVTKQRKPADAAAGFRDNRLLAAAQRKMCGVIQRATPVPTAPVSTDYGIFEATMYEINEKKTGVNMKLEFQPDPEKVDAILIGMVQSCCTTDQQGEPWEADPRVKRRVVRKGTAKGYKIDRLGNYRNPVYGVTDNSKPRLSSTPYTAPNSGATYGLGCSLKQGGRPDPAPRSAWMMDCPDNHARIEFETTALALYGSDAGKYYGSVKWGFDRTSGQLTPIPLAKVNGGNPSSNFVKAAKKWNKSSNGAARRSGHTFKARKAIVVDRVELLKDAAITYPFQWSANWKLKKLCLKIQGTDQKLYVDKTKIDTDTNKMKERVPCRLSAPVTVPEDTTPIKYNLDLKKGDDTGFLATVPGFDSVGVFILYSDVKRNNDGIDNIPLPIP